MASSEVYLSDPTTSEIPETDQKSYSLEYQVITSTLFFFLMVVLVFSNALVILAYIFKHIPRTLSNYYLTMLAGVDMSVGLAMPISMVSSASKYLGSSTTYCLFETVIGTCLIMGSNFALLSLTIDRYKALSSPLHYDAEMTRRRYIERTLLVWFIPLTLFFVLPYCWHNELHETPVKSCFTLYILKREFTAFIILPITLFNCICIAATYIPIVHIALRHSRTIYALQPGGETSEQILKMRSHLKIMKTTTMVLLPYYAAYIPWCIFATGVVYSKEAYSNPGPLFTAGQYALLGILANSGINPFVYAVRMPVYKAAFKNLLRCKDRLETQSAT